MIRTRIIVLIAILALLVGALGLVGCSSSDEPAEETESSTEETSDAESDDPLAGTWENPDGVYFSSITFASDGTGTATDVDGDEASITWTLEDDYLEITIETDDMTDTTGGGFSWEEESVTFVWDASGTFNKVE